MKSNEEKLSLALANIIKFAMSAGLFSLAWNAIAWECNLPCFTYWTWLAIAAGLHYATIKLS